MRKFLLFSIVLPVCLFAQISDDFSDGDFITGPTWTGDPDHFKLCNTSAVPEDQRPSLQLDATEPGISSLAFAVPIAGEVEWRFWIKLSLNTSFGNYARVYLMSNETDLKAPLNGY